MRVLPSDCRLSHYPVDFVACDAEQEGSESAPTEQTIVEQSVARCPALKSAGCPFSFGYFVGCQISFDLSSPIIWSDEGMWAAIFSWWRVWCVEIFAEVISFIDVPVDYAYAFGEGDAWAFNSFYGYRPP
ncbi:unnamed protein product [Cochlearia groenlandica]